MTVYSVSQVNSYLRELLAQDYILQDMWVQGEVANLARPGSGHSYFTLRDASTTLRCVMFRGAYGAELLSSGSAVVVHGRVSLYEVRGDLQLIVDIAQPEGVGELQLKLEQLKLKLEKEGLFDTSRKRPLPAFPQRVGVVTSPTGAVWHDIQTVIGRRYPLVELLLAPTAVQGEDAVGAIVEAFDALSETPDVDVIIVARGGGSLEDLWPFNEEAVARAIFSSQAPVISAIGHETDFTIADMVADQRAPTPSAAAELAVPDRLDLLDDLVTLQQTLTTCISDQLRAKRAEVANLGPRLRRSIPDLDTKRIRIDDLLRSTSQLLRRDIKLRYERARGLNMRLESLSPRDTMRRGYAIVQRRDDGAIVKDVEQVEVGDPVDVTLSRGGFAAKVVSIGG